MTPPPPESTESITTPSPLISAISISNWDATRHILSSSADPPRHINSLDVFGRNALHCACFYRDTPVDVLRALLSFSTSPQTSVSKDNALLHRDYYGIAPLHFALQSSAADEASDEMIEVVIKACPMAAHIVTKQGWSPLHYAVCYNRGVGVVKRLLEVWPEAVGLEDGQGESPMTLFWKKWNVGLRTVLERGAITRDKIVEGDKKSLFDGNARSLGDIYDITTLLFGASGPRDTLEMALKHPHCPWSFVQMILTMHPHEVLDRDNYLLHLATATPELFVERDCFDGNLYECRKCLQIIGEKPWYQHKNYIVSRYCQTCFWDEHEDSSFKEETDYLLVQSVNKTTAAVSYLLSFNETLASLPNNEERLPLHVILSSTYRCANAARLLFTVAPQSIMTRDVVTHMYPFMAAAATASDVNINEENFLEMYSLCFALIVEYPNITATLLLKF